MSVAAYPLTVLQNLRGKVTHPSWCTYLVCYRCNGRCDICDSWRMKPGRELTPDEVDVVFEKIGRLDVVRISGGEPYLREDLLEVAETIVRRSRPGTLHVTTNGSFPDRVEAFARAFSRPRTLRFMVSLDGLADAHDRHRGKEVTFKLAMETIRRLAAVRDERGTRVSVNHTVITPQSLADNAELRRRLGRDGVEVHSVLAYADSSMYGVKYRGKRADHMIGSTGYPLHPGLDRADVIGFVEDELEKVSEYRDRLTRMGKRYYLRGLLARLRDDAEPRPKPRCVALRSHIRLLPDGSVPVCQFNTEQIGNLLTDSFADVWQGADAVDRRAWVDGCPGCWAECEVMPNAIYTGDVLGI